MNDATKKEIYGQADLHVQHAAEDIKSYQNITEASIKRIRVDLTKEESDHENLIEMLLHRLETQRQLQIIYKSPYFVRCDVEFEDEKGIQTFYFGRFAFREDAIFSWVAPAASIRFESPGKFSYMLPNGNKRTGVLVRKDQYMIIDRQIFFLSSEALDYKRELVYQKHFTEQKPGFILPEIVEQMEKAQDTIIRSHYFGSFLVSGAAGSGKTTLALHRVAYLVQSPETEKMFNPSSIIVFVQDVSTKKYFSSLLPELGIYRVKITTFDEWAMRILGISSMSFIKRYGKTELEKDAYEYSKNAALLSIKISSSENKIEEKLKKVYGNFLSSEQKKLFNQQLNECYLDRFDLTILLKLKFLQDKIILEDVEKFKKIKIAVNIPKK